MREFVRKKRVVHYIVQCCTARHIMNECFLVIIHKSHFWLICLMINYYIGIDWLEIKITSVEIKLPMLTGATSLRYDVYHVQHLHTPGYHTFSSVIFLRFAVVHPSSFLVWPLLLLRGCMSRASRGWESRFLEYHITSPMHITSQITESLVRVLASNLSAIPTTFCHTHPALLATVFATIPESFALGDCCREMRTSTATSVLIHFKSRNVRHTCAIFRCVFALHGAGHRNTWCSRRICLGRFIEHGMSTDWQRTSQVLNLLYFDCRSSTLVDCSITKSERKLQKTKIIMMLTAVAAEILNILSWPITAAAYCDSPEDDW